MDDFEGAFEKKGDRIATIAFMPEDPPRLHPRFRTDPGQLGIVGLQRPLGHANSSFRMGPADVRHPMIAAAGAAVSRRRPDQRPAAEGRAYMAMTRSMARRHTAQKPTSSRVNMMQSACGR